MERITSAQNPKIKLAVRLKQKKYRDESGLFLTEGVRLGEEAVRSGWNLKFCVCAETAAVQPRTAALLREIEAAGCSAYCTTESVYEKMSDTKGPQGILLVVEKRAHALVDLRTEGKNLFLAVLDGVQDPGNVGSIVRTADAVGCDGVILLEPTADLYAPKTVRAAMGSIFHLPIYADVQAQAFVEFSAQHDISLLAAALDRNAASCFAVDLCRPLALVLGNEGNGVREKLLSSCDRKLFIPMKGAAESLNVSVAAAVLLYEVFRQRHR